MKKARLVVVVVAALVLPSIPARSDTRVGGHFIGDVVIAGGLGYPFPGTFTVTPNPGYPAAVVSGTRPFPHPFTVTGGTTAPFTWSSTVCGSTWLNVLKADVEPFYPATCTLSSSGVITGFCGLATGSGAGVFTGFAVPPFTTVQTMSFVYNFTVVGGTATFTGASWSNGQTGTMQGEFEAIASPTTGGSCTNGTQSVFTLVGGRA